VLRNGHTPDQIDLWLSCRSIRRPFVRLFLAVINRYPFSTFTFSVRFVWWSSLLPQLLLYHRYQFLSRSPRSIRTPSIVNSSCITSSVNCATVCFSSDEQLEITNIGSAKRETKTSLLLALNFYLFFHFFGFNILSLLLPL
jgi:hypothetical protein